MSTILHTRDRFQGLAGLPVPTASMWGWWSAEAAYTDAGKTTLCSSSGSDTCYTAADLSGNGRDMVQATSGSRPLWKSDRSNGKPSLTFDGTDDYLRSGTGTISTDYSFFMAFRNVTWTSGDNILGRGDGASTFSVNQDSTTPNIRVIGPGLESSSLPVNKFGAVHFGNNATNLIRVNNFPATTGVYASASIVGLEIASINSGAGPFGNIEFLELMAFSGVTILDGSDTQKAIMNYLAKKYNLGFSL